MPEIRLESAPAITVYWRAGCPFCTSFRRQLKRAGLEAEWVDIWRDTDAAAVVRSVADGNETVPTVVISDRVMINPTLSQILATMERLKPGSGVSTGARSTPRSVRQKLRRALFGGGNAGR